MTKLMMMVCPHDTIHEPERWYRLEQYLMQRLGTEVQFELSLDAVDFRENLPKAAIVYSNPTDQVAVLRDKGYLPIARPADQYDEVVFVANTDVATPTLEALQGAEIATVPALMPTYVAMHLLQDKGIQPAALHHKESWQGVISSIWGGDVRFGFIYKDTYDALSEQGKGMVHAFATSDTQKAYHTLNISPALAERKDEIAQLVLGMHNDAAGKELLTTLGIPQWLPVAESDLATMAAMMDMPLPTITE